MELEATSEMEMINDAWGDNESSAKPLRTATLIPAPGTSSALTSASEQQPRGKQSTSNLKKVVFNAPTGGFKSAGGKTRDDMAELLEDEKKSLKHLSEKEKKKRKTYERMVKEQMKLAPAKIHEALMAHPKDLSEKQMKDIQRRVEHKLMGGDILLRYTFAKRRGGKQRQRVMRIRLKDVIAEQDLGVEKCLVAGSDQCAMNEPAQNGSNVRSSSTPGSGDDHQYSPVSLNML